MPHITQISATDFDSGDAFDQYVIPKVPITTSAQQVTGIVMNGSNMTVNGNPVEPVPIKEAVGKFCNWLEKKQNVYLIAHNGRRFDFPVLASAIMSMDYAVQFFT